MRLVFLGTRGYIKIRSPYHYRHTSTLVIYKGKQVMLDCGIDWLGELYTINPDAVVITHAHPDHADGLKKGAPCPVYATSESWHSMHRYPVIHKKIIEARIPFTIGALLFEAFKVDHSIHAPAVGYRITAGTVSIFYVPDLVAIPEQHEALAGINLYIGDGAIVTRNLLVRMHDHKLTGHAPISTQLSWCEHGGVQQAIFTHCGSEIVRDDPDIIEQTIKSLGNSYHVKASIAYDGMTIIVKGS